LNTVCGYNYVSDFTDWLPAFENLLFQHWDLHVQPTENKIN
jgi:hypothetical protein